MKRLKTLSRFFRTSCFFQTEKGLPFLSPFGRVSRDFILPEICKRCLFLSSIQFAKLIPSYPYESKNSWFWDAAFYHAYSAPSKRAPRYARRSFVGLFRRKIALFRSLGAIHKELVAQRGIPIAFQVRLLHVSVCIVV